jgi:microcystin-dependent protein
MEGYIGEIRLFAGNFAPRNWALCFGQKTPISYYNALYSILGTQYGGDGRSFFMLPDLRGRRAVHVDHQNPYIYFRYPGTYFGAESVAIDYAKMPNHHHTISGKVELRSTPYGFDGASAELSPVGAYYGTTDGVTSYYTGEPDTQMAPSQLKINHEIELLPVGTYTPSPIDTREPYLALNYIICLEGLYPSRN